MSKRNALAIATMAEQSFRLGGGANPLKGELRSASARFQLEQATREWLKADKRTRPTRNDRANAKARRAFRESGNVILKPDQTLWTGHGIAAVGASITAQGSFTRPS